MLRPIAVNKMSAPSDDEITSLRKRIEAELTRLYYKHLPALESRPLNIIRAASSAEELELLEQKNMPAGGVRHRRQRAARTAAAVAKP